MIQRRIQLKTKLIFSIIIITFMAISTVGYYGYSKAKEVYIQKIEQSENNDIRNIIQSIEDKIYVMKEDAHFIANFYAMQKLLNWQSVGVKDKIDIWDRATKDTFSSLINLKKFYYKIRIIKLDGMENINVFFDKNSQGTVVQTADKMQNKSKKRYFLKAKKLKEGEVTISQMELNTEFGKITYPYVPIVHFSAVIYDKNGQKRGIAVINAYSKNFTNILNNSSNDGITKKRYMINNKGYYLFHKDKSKLWGEQLGHDESFKIDYPKIYQYIIENKNGKYKLKNKLYNFHKIYPDNRNEDEYWIVIIEVEEAEVFAPLNDFKMIFIIILIVTFLLIFYIIKVLIDSLLTPLQSVTKQITLLSKGEIKFIDIKYKSNDEINDLINSSNKLVNNIQSTINQAKNVSLGDFTNRLTPSSSRDALATAINSMTNRLEETSQIAKRLSYGDIDTYISINSDKDTLAHSLNALIDYFQQITKIAESIALGNYHVSFKPVGSNDRLGIAINDMTRTLKQVLSQADSIANGDYSKSIKPKSDDDKLGYALEKMTKTLYENRILNKQDNWFKDGLNSLGNRLSGVEDIKSLGYETISTMVKHLSASSGVIYLYDEEKNELFLKSSYAFVERDVFSSHFKKGEGVIGQVALEEQAIHLKNIKKSDFKIESGIINQEPLNTYTFPIVYEGRLMGVAEVASFEYYTSTDKEFMDKGAKLSSAYFFNVAQNMQIKELLEDSQRAYEELQVKSEELQQFNVQMEEQQQQLEQQAQDLTQKNSMLQDTKTELDTRAYELEKSSQYKSEFLANMSHELRTPLNSIILLSKMLSENIDKFDSDDIKKSEVIHQSGQDLLLLINDILDLSKIESGKMEIIYDDFDTQEILSQSQDLFSPIANEKNIKFIVEDHYNNIVQVDSVKLMQVIKNLLSNAFKFTQKGHVKLSISQNIAERLPLIISVKDTGIGIDRDKKELVFDAFKQIDGSISRNYGGTGLGLSISKKFTELMGGVIKVESDKGIGSTFSIHLPLITRDQKKRPLTHKTKMPKEDKNSSQILVKTMIESSKDELQNNNSILKNKVILITDDDSRNIFSLSSLLQHAGAKTLHALNGNEAIEVLSKNSVDLVLMDIMMPQMDGYATIIEIRKDKALSKLPIIAVTAKAMKEDRQKCIDAGANDYIAKPIEKDALLIMIKAWLFK
ncbi:MAG: ATP-binding protein [Sulfurovum sp.]